jgi:hypothetical protein
MTEHTANWHPGTIAQAEARLVELQAAVDQVDRLLRTYPEPPPMTTSAYDHQAYARWKQSALRRREALFSEYGEVKNWIVRRRLGDLVPLGLTPIEPFGPPPPPGVPPPPDNGNGRAPLMVAPEYVSLQLDADFNNTNYRNMSIADLSALRTRLKEQFVTGNALMAKFRADATQRYIPDYKAKRARLSSELAEVQRRIMSVSAELRRRPGPVAIKSPVPVELSQALADARNAAEIERGEPLDLLCAAYDLIGKLLSRADDLTLDGCEREVYRKVRRVVKRYRREEADLIDAHDSEAVP